MDLAQIASRRYTAKAFDPDRVIPAGQMEQLRALLTKAPSSVNSQPWHFIVAASRAGKDRIADALLPGFAYNEPKVRRASHVVVMCARLDLDDAHLAAILAREEAAGRFSNPEGRNAQANSRAFYVGLHRDQRRDLPDWMDKQVYLALGELLLGAAVLGIDACPIEGFDAAAIDAALGLPEKKLRSVVLCALGYSGEGDFNAKLPKSRLPADQLMSEI